MTNFNAFRPTLNSMEERSLMSASFAAPPAEPVGYVVTMSDALITSVTPAPTAQTREHILLARQVGVPAMAESAPYNHSNGGGNLGINIEPVAATYTKYDSVPGR